MENADWRIKCQYLQNEIVHLNQQISDQEKIIGLNKDSLNQILQKPQSSIPATLKVVLKALQEENSILKSQVESLQNERNHALAKVNDEEVTNKLQALINEQMTDAAERNERQMIYDLQSKVKQLSQELKESESTVQKLQQNKQIEENGLIVKIKEVDQISNNE